MVQLQQGQAVAPEQAQSDLAQAAASNNLLARLGITETRPSYVMEVLDGNFSAAEDALRTELRDRLAAMGIDDAKAAAYGIRSNKLEIGIQASSDQFGKLYGAMQAGSTISSYKLSDGSDVLVIDYGEQLSVKGKPSENNVDILVRTPDGNLYTISHMRKEDEEGNLIAVQTGRGRSEGIDMPVQRVTDSYIVTQHGVDNQTGTLITTGPAVLRRLDELSTDSNGGNNGLSALVQEAFHR